MTGISASQVLRRAWQIRPTSLESAATLVFIGLVDVLIGLAAWKAALLVALIVTVTCLLTAFEELRSERDAPVAGLAEGGGDASG